MNKNTHQDRPSETVTKNTFCLEKRIQSNTFSQKLDLNEWIFNNIKISQDFNILELCCGTGAQTRYLYNFVKSNGKLFALDISSEALNKIKKLKNNSDDGNNLIALESEIDYFDQKLIELNISPEYIDVIFCAYGLYYSKDIKTTLGKITKWLKRDGKIVIVGPYGANNNQFYQLLTDSGVVIPDYTYYTSSIFMNKIITPWASDNFESIRIKTLVNKISWRSSDEVISYWENTPNYDSSKLKSIKRSLDIHFNNNDTFENDKWIMLLEAKNIRS